jgi:drug/metabolite transporter (DMT)-like permease
VNEGIPSSIARTQGGTRGLYLAELLAMTVVLGWGVNAVVVKWAIADVPPILFTTSRYAMGFLILLALLRWREGSVGLARRDVLPMALLGFAGFGLYQDLWVSALGHTTASNSSIITGSSPVWTMLIAATIGSDAFSKSKVAGAGISFCGVFLVVGATHGFGFSGATAGDLITLLASVLWAVYMAVGAPLMGRLSPLRMTTWAVGFGLLAMLPPALLQLGSLDVAKVGVGTFGAFVYCGLVGTVYGSVVMAGVVKELGPMRGGLFLFLIPVVAVIAAAALLGEQIVAGQLIGGAIVVAGILISRSGKPAPSEAVAIAETSVPVP